LTPAELQDLVDGYRERDYREWERAAWVVSYLLKPHLKKGRSLSPKDLLPKREKS
jgi:hypothetical protein